MYPMCPFRPTAMATPGATASSIDVFTILSSVVRRAVSRPELFKPICGSMYLIGCGGTTDSLAGGGGGAQEPATTSTGYNKRAADFIDSTSGSWRDGFRSRTQALAA